MKAGHKGFSSLIASSERAVPSDVEAELAVSRQAFQLVNQHADRLVIERMLLTAAALIFAVSFMFLVMWLTMSEQKTKLYEADNIVCASQPLATNCWERKPR